MKRSTAFLLVASMVAGAILSWAVTDWAKDRAWRSRYVAAVNAAAEADSLRKVAEGAVDVYERRAMVAEGEKELAELELAEEREARRRAGHRLTSLTDVVASLQARLEGLTTATTTGDTTRIPIDAQDGPIRIRGDVRVAGRMDPPNADAVFMLNAVAAGIGLRVRLLEDEDGVPFVQVTAKDPDHVTIGSVESTIDIDRTGLGQEKAPSRLKWAALGGGITAAALAAANFIWGD